MFWFSPLLLDKWKEALSYRSPDVPTSGFLSKLFRFALMPSLTIDKAILSSLLIWLQSSWTWQIG